MHEPERRPLMTAYSLEQNKRIALEAFETLFNKRDYQAAKKFWSPDYIQHSAHIPPGRDGLFNLVRAAPPTLHYDNSLNLRARRLCDAARPLFRQRSVAQLGRR